MADYQITIDVDTPEEAAEIGIKIKAILQDIIENGGAEAEKFARDIIPKRTGRLSAGTESEAGSDSFHLTNDVYYGIWVDQGHMTPRAFKGHPAKHISHVGGKFFSDKIWQFVQDDVNTRCQALLGLK